MPSTSNQSIFFGRFQSRAQALASVASRATARHGMDMAWTQYVHSIDTVWTQYGHSMDTVWTQYGDSMNTVWTKHRYSMDTAWYEHVVPCPCRVAQSHNYILKPSKISD